MEQRATPVECTNEATRGTSTYLFGSLNPHEAGCESITIINITRVENKNFKDKRGNELQYSLSLFLFANWNLSQTHNSGIILLHFLYNHILIITITFD